MKSFTTLALILSFLTSGIVAQAGTLRCHGDRIQTPTGIVPATVNFDFRLYGLNGKISLVGLTGSLIADGETTHFKVDSIGNDTKFKADLYKNSICFRGINSSNDGVTSAEDISGTLFIERTPNRSGEILAHYLFEVDFMPGSADLVCSEEIN